MVKFLDRLLGKKSHSPSEGAESVVDPDLTITRANNEMQLHTQSAIAMWGIDTAVWSVDLDIGTITFTNDEKGIIVTAPVQVIGTYDTQQDTWLWGWDHPSVSESIGEYAQRVREFGEQYSLEKLTTREISISIDEAWEFTALACHLNGGQGGYRGVSGSTWVFMVYGPVTVEKID